MNSHFIGIDVGGTKIAAGVVALPGGEIKAKRTIPTHPERGGRAVLDDVLNLARELANEVAGTETAVTAIGLGICELVNREGHIASTNCIQWIGQPVQEQLSQIAPAVIEADVRAAALAEAVLGVGTAYQNFLFVTVGTGISCCIVLGGKPFLGARGITGTMASSPLSIVCERCGETNRRTLEEMSAGPSLVARLNAAGEHASDAREVLAAATAGDNIARRIVGNATEALGSQIGLLINTLDPEAVIVGGGLGLSEGIYWKDFVESTRRHIWSDLNRDLPIVRAGTGTDAGWLGAAVRAWKQFGQR